MCAFEKGNKINNKTELSKYFRSVIEQDRCGVVICNLEHEIIYYVMFSAFFKPHEDFFYQFP